MFDKIEVKNPKQQRKGDQNWIGAVGKDNVTAGIPGEYGFWTWINCFLKGFKKSQFVGKDKRKERQRLFLQGESDYICKGSYFRVITSKVLKIIDNLTLHWLKCLQS